MMTTSATRSIRWPKGLARKVKKLNAWMIARKGVLVAWSGGVDSTFLAVMAHRALGKAALAVTADSPSFPRADLRETRALGRRLG